MNINTVISERIYKHAIARKNGLLLAFTHQIEIDAAHLQHCPITAKRAADKPRVGVLETEHIALYFSQSNERKNARRLHGVFRRALCRLARCTHLLLLNRYRLRWPALRGA